MIVFRCVKCREQMDAPESLAGETLDCVKCGNVCQVPTASSSLAPANPPAQSQPIVNQVYLSAPKQSSAGAASVVLGLVAMFGSLVPFLNLGSIFFSVPGLIFGFSGLRHAKKHESGGAAISIVGILFNLLAMIPVLLSVAVIAAAVGLAGAASRGPSAVPATNVKPSAAWPDPEPPSAKTKESKPSPVTLPPPPVRPSSTPAPSAPPAKPAAVPVALKMPSRLLANDVLVQVVRADGSPKGIEIELSIVNNGAKPTYYRSWSERGDKDTTDATLTVEGSTIKVRRERVSLAMLSPGAGTSDLLRFDNTSLPRTGRIVLTLPGSRMGCDDITLEIPVAP